MREQLLTEFHSSFIGGHAGINATVKRLSSTFTWLGLKKDVAQFVKSCAVCQAIKHPNHKPYGLLQPLPTPSQPWHDISMDFITNLPPSKGKVIERIGEVAYKLELPAGSKIYPVFHVSLLKPSYGTANDSKGNLAAFDPKDDLAFLPEAIINSRTNSNGELEVLVKWEKHNLEEATWENFNSLKLQFPDLDYIGDNVTSDREGDNTAQHGQSPSPQHQAARIKARPAREVKKPMRYMN
ncbi:ty3-gypsy retrotransposon protein [Tanacetum coccineum]